ncbi:MAG: tRNA (adenosine(37)-N6)-threonylcarbamoyltransferase complex dimerization subunit type 1 TsaB [Alphaproteobacteria bacterium]|nr:tRNA (adenosine(37)-N6)-threonylcarbamoyltransferase complex dimerization subunit type 1 TsaB [Alphaproteobacteria bacterium]
MMILALHCATASCSVALWRDGRVVADRFEAMARGQAEALVPMIVATMDAAGWDYGDLDRLAVTIGPGTFTGLRIGLATARGLALATGLPLLGITTFDAIAFRAEPEDTVDGALLVAIESKRSPIYVQRFVDARTPVSVPALIAPQDLARWVDGRAQVVIGDAAVRAAAALRADGVPATESAAPSEPTASAVAAIAANRDVAADAPLPRPLYLAEPQTTLPPPDPRRAVR